MMQDLKYIKQRFEVLLKVKHEESMEFIKARFDEDDLKSIIYYLGELVAIHECEEKS